MTALAPKVRQTPRGSGAIAPRVTAAVCTRGRPEQLRRALRSLFAQRVPAAEILVVDNAPPDDRTRALVSGEFPAVRYVREPAPGLDFARNRALHEASHDVVAFIDDDAVADPDWLRFVRSTFAGFPNAGACTGRIDALSLDGAAPRLFEANGGLHAQRETPLHFPADARRSLRWRFAPRIAWALSGGSGANLAVRRDAALAVGGFDEALDLGEALPGGGDNDMLWRLLAGGWEVVYEPAARVAHEHRAHLSEVEQQIAGHHRAMVALVTKAVTTRATTRRARAGAAAYLAWRLVKPGVRMARRLVRLEPLPLRLLGRIWVESWRGLRAYPAARRLAEERRARAATPRA